MPRIIRQLTIQELIVFASGKSKRTGRTYTSYGRNLEEYLHKNNLTLQAMTSLDVKIFLQQMGKFDGAEEYLAINTGAAYKRYLNMLMNSIGRDDVVDWIQRNTKEIHHEDKFKVDLTLEEILRLIKVTEKPMLKLAWSLMAFDGLRAGECLGLYFSDVDVNAKTINLERHKGEEYFPKSMKENKKITIPLNEFSLSLFGQIPKKDRRIIPFSYKTLRKWFNQCVAQAEIRRKEYPITMHKLRHFFGHYWMHHKGEIQILKKVLRHSSLDYTLIYSNPSDVETKEEFAKVMSF